MWALDSRRFFRLAYRMSAYRGVMRLRAEAKEEAGRHGGAAYGAAGGGTRPVGVTDAELRYSADFAGVADWGRG